MSPNQSGLLQEQTVALTAAVLDEQGRPMDGTTVAWSSSGTAGVTVSCGEGAKTDLTYCTIGDVQDKMDVYVPSASMPRPLPVGVHVHGGGWVSGSRSTGTRFTELKETLLARGYLVASLDYRLDAGVSFSLLRVLHADHDLEPTSTIPIDPTSATIISRMAGFFDQRLR